MADIVIRELTPGDVEAAVAIAMAAWEPIFAQYREIVGEELFAVAFAHWREEKARQVRWACSDESSMRVCVAERRGETVGFITFRADERRSIGEIGNNAVLPVCQGQGIGTAMYRHVLGCFRALGLRAAKVTTGLDPAHAPARAAYQKAGFDIQLPSVTYYRML